MATFDEDANRLFQDAIDINSGIEDSGLSNPATFGQAERIFNTSIKLNEFKSSATISGDAGKESPTLSFRAYKTYIDLILEEFQSNGKGIKFILSQAALHLLNPDFGRGKLMNPLAMVLGPPPFARGIFTNTLDNPLGSMNPVSDNAAKDDVIRKLYEGNKTDLNIVGGIPPFDVDGPKTRVPSDTGGTKTSGAEGIPIIGPAIQALGGVNDGVTFDEKYKQLNIASKTERDKESFGDKIVFDPYENINIKREDPLLLISNPGEEDNSSLFKKFKPDYEKIFTKNVTGPDFGNGSRGHDFWLPKKGALSNITDNYAKHMRAVSNVDTFFSEEELEDGLLLADAIKVLPDFTHHVPFYFEDIRYSKDGTGKILAFRAFINSINESITPNWQQETFYGRIDPVSTYRNTGRTFDVTFRVVSFSQDGLKIMWKKINQFCKMLYPSYKDSRLFAGPIARMRIGDLCATDDGRGLPGFFTSVNFSYDESTTWEMSNLNGLDKVPHVAIISFSYQVIHEKNPELDENGNFNLSTFRKAGKLPDQARRNGEKQTQDAEQQDIDGIGTGDSEDSNSPVT
jgi:hypothetical protein